MVYDVFIKNEDDYEDKETKLRGMSRFGDDVKAFTAKGLEFRHALYAFVYVFVAAAAAAAATADKYHALICSIGASTTPLGLGIPV